MATIITERDKFILQTLDGYGILSTKQLRRLCFPKIDRCTALRRLRILKDKNLLESTHGYRGGELVWYLRPKASALVGSEYSIRQVSKNSLEHDVMASEVRLCLEANKIGQGWISGHYLRHKASAQIAPSLREANNIPDWLFSFQTENGPFVTALEVELSLKSPIRLQDTLRFYLEKEEVDFVWYVVPTEKFGQKIISTIAPWRYQRPQMRLGYSLVLQITNDIQNSKIVFENREVALFKH